MSKPKAIANRESGGFKRDAEARQEVERRPSSCPRSASPLSTLDSHNPPDHNESLVTIETGQLRRGTGWIGRGEI